MQRGRFFRQNRKDESLDGISTSSQIAMSEKLAYVIATIFKYWLASHFLPRKPAGTVLLIVDSHTSHTNSVEVVEYCEEHNIICVCLLLFGLLKPSQKNSSISRPFTAQPGCAHYPHSSTVEDNPTPGRLLYDDISPVRKKVQ